MPTVKEIEEVWDIPPSPKIPANETPEQAEARKNTPEQQKYDRKVAVLLWWLDEFLPHAVGLEFWGPDVRCFHLITDKAIIDGDPSGVPKVYVTVTSEAFAHVLFANCRDNWTAQAKFAKNNKGTKKSRKVKAPQYKHDDPTTHVYRNKWSNSRTGQVAGGGWDEGAFEYLAKMQQKIQKLRKAQQSEGNKLFQFGLTLMKVTHDLELDSTKDPTKGKNKRKAAGDSEQPAKKQPQIIYIDE